MKLIRKILVKVLELEGYLKLISRIYNRMISLGMKKQKYHELYFVKEIFILKKHFLNSIQKNDIFSVNQDFDFITR